MKGNENLRNAIFEVIDNQINANDPVETAITLKRLMNEGYSELESKQLIGQALTIELFDVMKKKVPFNETRYIKHLKHLPKEPGDKSESTCCNRWLIDVDHSARFHLLIAIWNTGLKSFFTSCGHFYP